MRSVCCGIAEPRAWRAGFTLLELVVVVALLGLMASLVGVRVASTSAVAQERAILQALVNVLATTRVESMRRGAVLSCSYVLEGDRLVVDGPGMHRAIDTRGLIAIDDKAEPMKGGRADFDGSGRTLQRVWWFASPETNRTALLNGNVLRAPWDVSDAPAGDVPGRVWRIVFDPLSGAPRVERSDRTEESE